MIGLSNSIIQYLSKGNYTIQELADILDVTPQTIRNKIKQINIDSQLIINKNNVLELVDLEHKPTKLNEIEYIIFNILIDNVKVTQLASDLFRSEKTIYRKVSEQKKLIKKEILENFLQAHLYVEQHYYDYYDLVSIKNNNKDYFHKLLYNSKLYDYEGIEFEEVLLMIKDLNEHKNTLFVDEAESFYERFIKFLQSSSFKVNLTEQTSQELKSHIVGSYLRYKYTIEDAQIDSSNVFAKYYKEYNIASFNFKLFFSLENMQILPEEIAYLFVLLIKNISKVDSVKDVAIFCENGVASAYFVKEQLNQYFKNFNVIFVGKRPKVIDNFYKDNLLIISVGSKLTADNIITVSVKLTKKDLENLSYKLDYKYGDESDGNELYYRLRNLLKNDVTIDDFKNNLQQMKKGELMFKDLINEEFIRKEKSVATWQDSIKECAKPLLEKGYITPEYINAMIENVIEFGTYIILIDGFALPHSKPEDGSLKLGISMLVLDEKIKYPGDKEVGVILTLSSIDNTTHLNALMNLTKLLERDNIIDTIMSFRTPKEINNFIQDHE